MPPVSEYCNDDSSWDDYGRTDHGKVHNLLINIDIRKFI